MKLTNWLRSSRSRAARRDAEIIATGMNFSKLGLPPQEFVIDLERGCTPSLADNTVVNRERMSMDFNVAETKRLHLATGEFLERQRTEVSNNMELTLLEAMEANGGGFAKALSRAWLLADSGNKNKLRNTFGELLDTYKKFL